MFSYCVSDFEMVPVAPVITGIIFVFTFSHALNFYYNIIRCLHFKIFSVSFLNKFLSPGTETSINIHVPCLLPRLMVYLLTPWSRVILEKLTGSAASQEIPRLFGTRRFLTVPTSARHLSLS